MVTVQSPRSRPTRSSSVVTISRPPILPHLSIITNRSFRHAAPRIWNKLPHSFREPYPHPGLSPSHYPTQVRSTLSSPPVTINHSLFFTLDLKHSSPSSPFHRRFHHHWTDLMDSRPDRFSFAHRFCFNFLGLG